MRYAHTLEGMSSDCWEPLEHHLERVASLAGDYANAFGAREWGIILGRWHDLGKYSDAFQQYLLRSGDPDAGEDEEAPGRVDHSTFGAQHAAREFVGPAGRILAFCIAGHHAGLTDATAVDATRQRSTLEARLQLGPPRVPAVQLPADIVVPEKPKIPFRPSPEHIGFQVAFFTRMLFSCLIDADRTATEEFCDRERAISRNRPKPAVGELRERLKSFLTDVEATAPATPVNRIRSEVLSDCLTSSSLAPGFFSLNVPTGGGKTYSSLAFALDHAVIHDLRRVVVAIPFTSIIEQTADVYRLALGSLACDGLVEHHSNIVPEKDTCENQLAAENWDAPLIVTTNVQLYESLLASATRSCRKLHRLARSVIILDEAQTIPVELLQPTLLALRELVEHYGCSVVFCTATQPALEWRTAFPIGVKDVRAIIRDVPALFTALQRTTVISLGKISDDELVDRLSAERAALCIVNSRAHAKKVYDTLTSRLGDTGCFHLSTWMCAQHRRETLAKVRRSLTMGEPCRVISTQLVEAGVDVDFPAVYRASAGFDSVAQAAGRCNREGKLPCGTVYLFDAEAPIPAGFLQQTAQIARELIPLHPNPLVPDAIRAYFEHLYWSQSHRWDCHGVMTALTDDLRNPQLRLKFRTAASLYHIIRDDQISIVVPYDSAGRAIYDHLLSGAYSDYAVLRAVQPYLVGVHERLFRALWGQQVLVKQENPTADIGLFLLGNMHAYSAATGLSPDAVGLGSDLLIV